MPRLLESAMDSVVDSTATMSRRDEDDGTRWGEANNVAADVSPLDELVPTSSMVGARHPALRLNVRRVSPYFFRNLES